jgi:hypothetical protein
MLIRQLRVRRGGNAPKERKVVMSHGAPRLCEITLGAAVAALLTPDALCYARRTGVVGQGGGALGAPGGRIRGRVQHLYGFARMREASHQYWMILGRKVHVENPDIKFNFCAARAKDCPDARAHAFVTHSNLENWRRRSI